MAMVNNNHPPQPNATTWQFHVTLKHHVHENQRRISIVISTNFPLHNQQIQERAKSLCYQQGWHNRQLQVSLNWEVA